MIGSSPFLPPIQWIPLSTSHVEPAYHLRFKNTTRRPFFLKDKLEFDVKNGKHTTRRPFFLKDKLAFDAKNGKQASVCILLSSTCSSIYFLKNNGQLFVETINRTLNSGFVHNELEATVETPLLFPFAKYCSSYICSNLYRFLQY